jgi:hypothetical protein
LYINVLLVLITIFFISCQTSDSNPQEVSSHTGDDMNHSIPDRQVEDLSDLGMNSIDISMSNNACRYEGTPYTTARCLRPTLDPDYYIAQANAYFDTLDITADRESIPLYHDQVVRWEWPPWLLLTGYTRDEMNLTANVLRDLDPSTVPIRDCQFFDQQPFVRCYVVFEYEGGLCPIYEEFMFNEKGEMTWIEAWSNLPGLLPQSEDDRWAESEDYPRLGGRVPGLGQTMGEFDWMNEFVTQEIEGDEELADFIMRTTNWRMYWLETFTQAPTDFFAMGCGWSLNETE